MTPVSPPPKNSNSDSNIINSHSTTPIPIRTLQDHGTVGAVVNDGSDLSYDLSSNDDNSHTDDDIELDVSNKVASENARVRGSTRSSTSPRRRKLPLPLPPTQVIIKPEIIDKKNDINDDDAFSLDEGPNPSKPNNDDDDDNFNQSLIEINDNLAKDDAKLAEDWINNVNGINGITQIPDLDLYKNNNKYDGQDVDKTSDKKVELGLKQIADWIKSGKCSKIVVLCGAGVSCSAGIPDFRTPGSGL